VRAEQERKKTLSHLLRRRVTVKVMAVAAYVTAVAWLAHPSRPSFLAGLAVIAVGEAIRLWAAGHLQKNLQVTTTGPYAHVKNPLYLGALLILAGFLVMSQVWVLGAIGLVVFFAYYAPFKKQRESDRLRERFGQQWVDYDRAVPDYLPRLSPYAGRGAAQWQPALVVENSEHGTAAAVLFGVVLIGLRWWLLAP
jgi:protein-S-isoprenylcysteine O-methyltransferase Ste14